MRNIRDMGSDNERTTVVQTSRLLETLKANRAAHVKEYKEAVEGYLDEARGRLEEEFVNAQRQLEKAFERTKHELEMFDPTKASDTIIFCKGISFTLTAPRNYVDAYDQAIQMMEWETREQVELNATEFRCFVMNKWDWMEEFKMSTTNYLNKR